MKRKPSQHKSSQFKKLQRYTLKTSQSTKLENLRRIMSTYVWPTKIKPKGDKYFKQIYNKWWDGNNWEGGNLPRVMRWLSGWRCQDPHKRTKSQLPKSKSKQINCWVLQEFQKQTPKFPKLRTEKYQIIFIKLVLILIPVPEKKNLKTKL